MVNLRNGELKKKMLGIIGSIGLLEIVVNSFQYSTQRQKLSAGYIIEKGMGDINNHDNYEYYFIY